MKMFLITLLFSASAMAHLEEGNFNGTTNTGESCTMTVGKNYFENNFAHPLNERIEVTVENEKFVVQHPAVVNTEEQTASYNHDLFQGVAPNKLGAKALVIKMSHSENSEGPTEFNLIQHEYKANIRSLKTCLNLKHED